MKKRKTIKPEMIERSKRLSQAEEVESLNGMVKLTPTQRAHMISLNKLKELSLEKQRN